MRFLMGFLLGHFLTTLKFMPSEGLSPPLWDLKKFLNLYDPDDELHNWWINVDLLNKQSPFLNYCEWFELSTDMIIKSYLEQWWFIYDKICSALIRYISTNLAALDVHFSFGFFLFFVHVLILLLFLWIPPIGLNNEELAIVRFLILICILTPLLRIVILFCLPS